MTSARFTRVIGTILLTITIFSLSLPAYAKYSGGMGEPNEPYQIWTAKQMNKIEMNPDDRNKQIKSMADINLGLFGSVQETNTIVKNLRLTTLSFNTGTVNILVRL